MLQLRKNLMNLTLALTLATALILSGCSKDANTTAGKKAELSKLKSQLSEIENKISALEKDLGSEINKQAPVLVKAYEVKSETFRRFLDVPGHVESQKLAMLSTTMGGTVMRINVSEGSSVKKGAVLVELNSDILEKNLAELENSYDFVNKLYVKQTNLWEQKAISEVQYLQAKNNKESLELKIETVKRQLKESRVIAPFDGSIDRIFPKIGEIMAPGLPIVQLSGGGNLKVVSNVSESYISTFRVGDPVSVKFTEINKDFNSKISVISKAIDTRTRTFRVEAGSSGLPSEIRPNMLCEMKFNDISIPNSLTVPLSSLQKSTEGYFLYVVEKNSAPVARKKFVKVGIVADSKAQIIDGLNENDLIISEGVLDVADGQKITIKY